MKAKKSYDKFYVAQTQNFVKYHIVQKHGPWSGSSSLLYTSMIHCTCTFRVHALKILKYSLVVNLQGGSLAPCAVQVIQLAESTLGPDAEPSNVTTGSEPQKVQFVHVQQSDACKMQHNNQTSACWWTNYLEAIVSFKGQLTYLRLNYAINTTITTHQYSGRL